MNINGIASGMPLAANSPSGDVDGLIRSLEQKLMQLTKEKDKATKAQNEEKVRELDKEIQEVRRKITELKRQEIQQKPQEVASEDDRNSENVAFGRFFDEMV